jgi:hypothetical protein
MAALTAARAEIEEWRQRDQQRIGARLRRWLTSWRNGSWITRQR